MKAAIKTKPVSPLSRRRTRPISVKGDIARAMFARWEKDHVDPQPMSWNKLKTKLEENRLREAPLFPK